MGPISILEILLCKAPGERVIGGSAGVRVEGGGRDVHDAALVAARDVSVAGAGALVRAFPGPSPDPDEGNDAHPDHKTDDENHVEEREASVRRRMGRQRGAAALWHRVSDARDDGQDDRHDDFQSLLHRFSLSPLG